MPARAAEKIMSWFSAEHLAEVRSAFLLSGLHLSFGLRTAECIAQCLNLEHEFHDTASERGILGLEPLK